ncbi:MAG: NPCBM/NEW2 domain-containing protein [Pirellulales bacterium]
MTRRASPLALALLAGFFAAGPAHAEEAPPRHTVVFADGTRSSIEKLNAWYWAPMQRWKPDERALADPAKPVRWLRDDGLSPGPEPAAFVEFFGGDRLPGRVVGCQPGAESPYVRLPAHLLVEPSGSFDWPEQSRQHLGVRPSLVRRVVWRRVSGERYAPSTLWFLDGRQLAYTKLRWNNGSVSVLVEDASTRQIPFDQIAEIHLPRVKAWDAYYEQLALLCPGGDDRLVQFETVDGLAMTVSSGRIRPENYGNGDDSANWRFWAQPAWSLDPLAPPPSRVWLIRYFQPHEVPLSMIEPSRAAERSSLAGGWNWRANRNVQGGPLRSGEKDFAWGLGVQAQSELEFDLPPGVRSFHAQLGLDELAGRGGCARAQIFVNRAEGTPLYQSDPLVGSAQVADTGSLALAGPSAGQERLILRADPVDGSRPPGADPLNIRDMLDWLEPTFELDAKALQTELARRAAESFSAWQDWTLAPGDEKEIELSNRWTLDERRIPVCRHEVRSRGVFFTLSRRVEVTAQTNWLMLMASRAEKKSTPTRIQVRVDGKPVAEPEVKERAYGNEPEPMMVPLGKYVGRTVNLQMIVMPEGDEAWVDWRRVALVSSPPELVRLFEDEAGFLAALNEGQGEAIAETNDRYSGTGAIRVQSQERSNPQLPGLKARICEYPRPGEFRYLRFAWKKKGDGRICLSLAHDGKFGPETSGESRGTRGYRLDAGTGPLSYDAAVRVDKKPPAEWTVVTRDLFADFGNFNLTGLSLASPDAGSALFDHIYLARNQDDFRYCAAPLKPPATPAPEPPAGFPDVLAEVAPGFSVSGAGESGPRLVEEHAGRRRVISTCPVVRDRPCVLRAPIQVPEGKPTRLVMLVSHQISPPKDWQLIVKANGEMLHDSIVDSKATKDGWAEISVDLARFAGRRIVLEIHNQANNWDGEHAFWGKVELKDQ